MISKADKLYISMYNDIYGGLLSGNTGEMVRMYYDCDLSLNEIAEQFNVTRQAVHDTLQRAEKQLISYEAELRLYEKRRRIRDIADYCNSDGVEELRHRLNCISDITEENNGCF